LRKHGERERNTIIVYINKGCVIVVDAVVFSFCRKMPPFYVALCHIRPKTGLTEPVVEKLTTLIKSGGGLVRRVNNSGIRPLPTEMRGKGVAEFHKFASIASVEFISNPPLAVSTTQQIRGLDDVIRISLLRADDLLLNRPPRPSLKSIAAMEQSQQQQQQQHQFTSRYDRLQNSTKPRPPHFENKPRISFLNEKLFEQKDATTTTSDNESITSPPGNESSDEKRKS